ncbi:MAG TPA: molecular chaperone [Nevskiaceae bacterium]|nr:molecular chaperone [Nevskiaceae bacterium]
MRALLLGALLLAASAASASPGGFTVSPVRLDLAPGARATSITLLNDGDLPKTVQVEAFRWTQVDGEDRYEPVTDLVVNPPVFKLSPKGRQVIRAGFRGGAPSGAQEIAYRLYFQELADDTSAFEGGLRMLLRIGVPLFVAPASTAPATTAWRVIGAGTPDAQLEVANHGNTHLRLSSLAVLDRDGRTFDLPGFAYVLPGQTRRWTLPRDPAPPLRVVAQSDLGALDAALPDR